jgi:pimeloyl-ACP methyl ester carboxylesterase
MAPSPDPVTRFAVQSTDGLPSRLQFVRAPNGIRYAYRSFGSVEGDPLVLLSCFRANLDMWDRRLIQNLAAQRRVIVVDNSGVGLSGGAPSRTVGDMAEHLCAFVDAVGLARIDLLGFSLGGYVAQQVSIDRPKLVRRLILAGTAARGTGRDLALGGRVQEVTVKQGIGPKDLFFLFFAPGQEGRRRGLEYIRNLPTGAELRDVPVSEPAWRAQIEAANEWAESPEPCATGAERISCPTFVAHGELDVMVSTMQGRLLADLIPNAVLKVFPGAGHAFLFEEVAEFTVDVLRFLGPSCAR